MGSRSITYHYPAVGANNGKITSMVDSGEAVTYQYDSLQRLTYAAGSGWTQSFTCSTAFSGNSANGPGDRRGAGRKGARQARQSGGRPPATPDDRLCGPAVFWSNR
jgi:hypothetical protein